MPEGPLTLAEYGDAYRAGTLTPADAIGEVYRRIARHGDPAVFITLRPEADVRAEAVALEGRRVNALPLYGIPVAVKDNLDVAGLPTTCACPDFAYTPERDAEAVSRLRAAGALVVGKTNLDQFATGLVGVRSPYGAPRNTFRPDIVPGGSSSGSAVAVAAGLVPLALGTDTAGSGRVPAGLNNIVGLKPTPGAVSTRGLVPACRTLDCVSVFALTVADAWTALEVIAGYDAADPFSREVEIGQPAPVGSRLRIGVPDLASRRFGGDAAAEAAFDASLAGLLPAGARPRPVDMAPLFAVAALLYDGPWVAERYEAIRTFFEARPDSLHPVTRAITATARNFSAADAFAGRYRLADLRRATEAIWRDVDILVVPTFPRPRTLADLEADPIGPSAELGTYTNFANLLDLCALAVPGLFRPDALPAGLTLLALPGGDAMLASLGSAMQAKSRTPLGATWRVLQSAEPPRSAAPAITPGEIEIEIAVVGAHMSGLPLNGELTSRGGRFLRAVATAPDYRLFALAGGPPRRPGLLRVGAGSGAAIDTEVWALPTDAVGAFLAGIPPPLTIGTLRLADGTLPKGFLVEAEAIYDAQDISAYGGWRAYMARLAA